ncbi:uncharacterized protein SAPINGB_P003292 [Magnusiomyces paraingens]|uniref:Carboxylic ester hydrolase n=1 Tax=Magnusiomyces paraingens TaxID=2606893 RepID=A0A5E8BK28_9ASCO|nr:uncharacterized protein SAPINGB_P003292 [Saprochaete ingens]VVT52026.1 unnamed protein product [Saprochaete ingens]
MTGWDYAVNFLLYLQCLLTVRFATGNTCSTNLTTCSVATTTGRIVGDCSNPTLYKYFSIPYAKPPIGDLRLEDPISFTQNSTVLIQGNELPSYCPQIGNSDESEDCLYLNIWSPSSLSISRPVLFWIHGGSNLLGSGSDPYFEGTKFASSQNVVIVTYNYRLGLLGYFDDNDNTNFAIKDTIMALKWVQDNISRFGGNKNLVTVFGNSSGGAIIRALMSSSKANGLFQRAIIQSDPDGYGFNERSFSNGYLTAKFLEMLGCDDKACVKTKSISDIVTAQLSVASTQINPLQYPKVNIASIIAPIIDGDLIIKDYWEYVNSGSLPSGVDTIVGFTKDEGGAAINTLLPSALTAESAINTAYYLLGVDRASYLLASNVFPFNTYTGDGRSILANISTDLLWRCPTQYISRRIVETKMRNIYLYQLNKGIQYSTNINYPLCTNAVCHQDDIPLTFGNYPSGTSTDLQSLSLSIQTAWAKFAKYGYPQTCGSISWPKALTTSNLNICQFGSNSLLASVTPNECQVFDSIKYPFQL